MIQPLMRNILFTAIILSTFLAAPSFGQTKSDREIEGVTSIAGPTMTDEQLTPLLHPLFKDTSILGIGENVHGSSQILKMQSRLIQYGVEKEGIRLIFLESDDAESESLNGYLKTGQGDIVSILKRFAGGPFKKK